MIPHRLLPVSATLTLVPAILIGAILFVVGLPLWLAAVVAIIVPLAWVIVITRSAPGRVTKNLTTTRVTEVDEPRLFNLLDGLVFAHGLDHPDVALVECDAPNAAVFGSTRETTVLITRGLLGMLDRMQFEAVLAQLLTTARDHEVAAATVGAAYAGAVPSAAFRRWVLQRVAAEDGDIRADIAAARLTRYPPALASALELLVGRSTTIAGVADTHAHLWLAAPITGHEIAPRWSVPDRVSALQEL